MLWELQVLVGHINFACKVVFPGCTFLRCLCDAMVRVCQLHHRVRVTTGMKQDLQVWLSFLEGFNGIAFWHEEVCLEVELQVHSDATGSLGLEIYF